MEPSFVAETNAENRNVAWFHGSYLSTEGAQPFEVWLAMMGDYAIAYETQKYQMQRPPSFVNWPTTDVMRQTNEPNKIEDMVSVNFEAIKARLGFPAGCMRIRRPGNCLKGRFYRRKGLPEKPN